jgi:hypothetical protein
MYIIVHIVIIYQQWCANILFQFNHIAQLMYFFFNFLQIMFAIWSRTLCRTRFLASFRYYATINSETHLSIAPPDDVLHRSTVAPDLLK